MMRKIAPPLEREEEKKIIEIYELAGCKVVSFSQRQRSQQTAGIPDLRIYSPRKKRAWWHEVKRQHGPRFLKVQYGQTPPQRAFQELVEEFGEDYVLGARDAAARKLREVGLVV